MQINKNLHVLHITADLGGHPFSFRLPVLVNEDQIMLVDSGLPGGWPLIKEELVADGLGEKELVGIILTHQDFDHIGGVAAILNDYPEALVIALDEEVSYLNGEQPFVKLTPERMQTLPAAFQDKFGRANDNVTKIVSDGDTMTFGRTWQFVATPGHTPGHMSLYDAQDKLLITGDALRIDGDKLTPPAPQNTPDYPTAIDSVAKLAELPIENVIAYHDGMLQGSEFNAEMLQMVRNYLAEGL
ncbi:MBL fold metallo-hydrolase [Periweissella cryptocerci]|uniref:MBL fold metallo-hydrolase n=1 Tax=Periweissella cryptocerci TaxID=2506420 RepID=A0A4P6YWQ0_9LACO|nr:MBL fold metallo-hydrolase [Periweissella cryptocerci]QBO37231.1 MBL fold metallo-hydrolase [Periweissella cryptocerci]